jgi:hypothetical protein
MATDNTTIITVKAKNETEATFNKVKSDMTGMKTAHDNMAASVFKGVAAWDLLKKGVRMAIDFLGESVKASMDAEAEMAIVKTNVENAGFAYSEVGGKIEEYSKKMIKMGFNDEATALSVSRLMAVTKDYDKAILLNNLAMDLARNKKIDLETATQALIKATQGDARLLKQYGIEVSDTASAADNLNEVYKKVKGSSDAYTDTAAGKMETVKEEWINIKEEIGNKVQPVVNGLMDAFNDNLPAITKAVEGLATALGWVAESAIKATGYVVELFEKRPNQLLDATTKTADAAKKTADTISSINSSISGPDELAKFMPSAIMASGLAIIKKSNEEFTASIEKTAKAAGEVPKNPFAGIGAGAKSATSDANKLEAALKRQQDAMTALTSKVRDYKQSILDIQKAQEDEAESFIKSQIEKKQSFDQQLADMIASHKEKWNSANKEAQDLEKKTDKTQEDYDKLMELGRTRDKEFAIVQPYLNNAEMTKMAETSDVERLITAFRAGQAEETVATGAAQQQLVEKAQNITINFDLTNSTITDVNFIERIKQEINKSLNLIRSTN